MKNERSAHPSAPVDELVPTRVGQDVCDLNNRFSGRCDMQPLPDIHNNVLNGRSEERDVGRTLSIFETRRLVEHRCVQTCIHQNYPAPRRGPALGHR